MKENLEILKKISRAITLPIISYKLDEVLKKVGLKNTTAKMLRMLANALGKQK